MLNRLNNLSTTWFPENTNPFIYMEVIDLGGEPITVDEYTPFGRYTRPLISCIIVDLSNFSPCHKRYCHIIYISFPLA